MKKILYFDASSGISGDMFVGALIDAGADIETIRGHINSLDLEGFGIRARKVSKSGLMGTKFDVINNETGRDVDAPEDNLPNHSHGRDHRRDHGHHGHSHDHGNDHDHSHSHKHSHRHEHHHGHDNSHNHDHDHDHDHNEHSHSHDHEHTHDHLHRHDGHSHNHHSHGHKGDVHHGNGLNDHHRGLREIGEIISGSGIPQQIKDDALAVFRLIAAAEAKVHGTTMEDVHFHEIGAIDCIVDIVSAASAYHQLDLDEVWCSPIHVGSGTVRCAHGVLPVPAPATMELLQGVPIYSTEIKGELATPTGAALVRHFCKGFAPMPQMIVERVGYGSGNKDFGIPNLLRATIGKINESVVIS